MNKKLTRTRQKAGRPAKRSSAVKGKKPVNAAAATRHYAVRAWWIMRGAALGTLFLGVLYGGYLGVGKIVTLESLSVRTIDVEGCRRTSPESIVSMSGVSKGDPLLKVDLEEVRGRVLRHPGVRDAAVVRELPGTLRIRVHERNPVAAVMGEGFCLVDEETVVVERLAAYPEGYPLITGSVGGGRPGSTVMEARAAITVLGYLAGSGLLGADRISELAVGPGTVSVALVGSGTVLLFSDREIGPQVERLARLVKAGAFDALAPGYDLRYAGRVIGMAENRKQAGRGHAVVPAGG